MAHCPVCDTPDAYIGFLVVECLNPQCRHFLDAAGGTAPSRSPELQATIDAFLAEDFPREVEKIQEAVGVCIPVTMDFRNTGDNAKAVRLLIRTLDRVRGACCIMSGQHQEALAEGVKRVAIRHVSDEEDESCTLIDGVLDMRVSVNTPSTADVEQMIKDAMDLEVGPRIRELQPWLKGHIDEMNADLRTATEIEVDWESFTNADTTRDILLTLDRLSSELSSSILYWIHSHGANNKDFKRQLKHTIKTFKLEHVPAAAQRELTVDGSTVVYRFNLTESGGSYGYDLGDVLLAAVLSVQAPPSDDALNEWSSRFAGVELQRIKDAVESIDVREQCEAFLAKELPTAALRIGAVAKALPTIEIDWASVARSSGAIAQINNRVLSRIAGGVRLAIRNDEHAPLIEEGLLRAIRIVCVDAGAPTSCAFDGTLTLTVNPLESTGGCFTENEIAQALYGPLEVEVRVRRLRDKEIPDYERRLCEELGTYIELDVDFASFCSHPDVNKNIFALLNLDQSAVNWVYYALTGTHDDDTRYRDKIVSRVRRVKLVSVPDAKQKAVVADGSTLVYSLFLHQDYEGRFPINHLIEIFNEVMATMPDNAPPSGRVLERLDQIERELIPAAAAKIEAAIGTTVPIEFDRASVGGNMLAIRGVGPNGLDELVQAIERMAEEPEDRQALKEHLKRITLRHVDNRSHNECVFAEGEMRLASFLCDSNGLNYADICNSTRDSLPRPEEPVETNDSDSGSNYQGGDNSAWLNEFRQMMPSYTMMVGHMGQCPVEVEADWDEFSKRLAIDATGHARACVESGIPILFSSMLQVLMMNPAVAAKMRSTMKTVRLECAGDMEPKELRVDGTALVVRMRVFDGPDGAHSMPELMDLLPKLFA